MTAKELRSKAREALDGRWFKAIVVAILAWFIPQLISLINPSTYMDRFGEHPMTTLDYFELIFLLVTTAAFVMGLTVFFLNLIRDKDSAQISDVFSWFRTTRRFFKSLGYYFLSLIYLFLWSLLLIIPGIIKGYSYALTAFILVDEPELSPNQAITKSRKMMDGKKLKMFYLDLSFIGWFLLSVLTLGIGFIWLAPYFMTAHAEFYQMVKEEHDSESLDPIV